MVVGPVLHLAYLCDVPEWWLRLAQPQKSEESQEGSLRGTLHRVVVMETNMPLIRVEETRMCCNM